MNKYELMYIIDTALEDTARKALIERVSTLITGNGGELEKVDEWGKRRLAYSINYKNEGYYVLVNFSAGPELPQEIERVLQISEDVLRYLIVKLEQKRSSVKPRPASARPVYGRPPMPPDSRDESAELPAAEKAMPADEVAPVAEEAMPAAEVAPAAEEAAPAEAQAPAETEAPPETEATAEAEAEGGPAPDPEA